MHDPVKKPSHYTQQVPGIECKDVTVHFNFNRGNIIKYAWRCGDKGNAIEDLKKIKEYADFEIDRLAAAAVAEVKKKKVTVEEEGEGEWMGMPFIDFLETTERLPSHIWSMLNKKELRKIAHQEKIPFATIEKFQCLK